MKIEDMVLSEWQKKIIEFGGKLSAVCDECGDMIPGFVPSDKDKKNPHYNFDARFDMTNIEGMNKWMDWADSVSLSETGELRRNHFVQSGKRVDGKRVAGDHMTLFYGHKNGASRDPNSVHSFFSDEGE